MFQYRPVREHTKSLLRLIKATKKKKKKLQRKEASAFFQIAKMLVLIMCQAPCQIALCINSCNLHDNFGKEMPPLLLF